MVKRRSNLVAILLMFILLFIFSIKAQASSEATRLAGANRYATSEMVAIEGWEQSDYALLASGEDFPDALSAAPLAKKYNAPILLTRKNEIPPETINALQQLKVKTIFIIGGTGAISTLVQSSINSMGIETIRLFGQDRYETDIKVAEQLDNVSEIAIVTGDDFSDALSISPIAVKRNMPIILIQHNVIPQVVKAYIENHNITKTYVIGAGSTIDETALTGLTNVEAISGEDKYERNLAIINSFKSDLDFSTVYVASGESYPDGLSGSILAGKNSNPMLLVGNEVSAQKDYLSKNSIKMNNIKILGGTGVVADTIINSLIDTSGNGNTILTVTEIAKNVNAIVRVETKDANNTVLAMESGCLISSDGKLITNYHVISGAYSVDVLLEDGTKYEVEGILGYSKEKDLAILKLKNANGLSSVKLGDSDTLQLGNGIVTIGSPFGFQGTVAAGIVSGVNRKNSREGKDLQISAVVSEGSSGGGLFNMYGQVVGITYQGLDSTGNFNYAIPINEVKPLMGITVVTTLAQLAQVTTTVTINYFPKLSDVPMPQNANYYKTILSTNGKNVFYYYSMSSVWSNFLSSYYDMLATKGFKLSTATVDSNGKTVSNYTKGDNSITIGTDGYDIYIMGNIH